MSREIELRRLDRHDGCELVCELRTFVQELVSRLNPANWRPLAAFDDGRQVFIEMPEKIRTMEAPPLFVIGDGGPELVNYRVAGKYYVVDRLFTKAELRLGSGWGEKKVQIYRQTPIAGGGIG